MRVTFLLLLIIWANFSFSQGEILSPSEMQEDFTQFKQQLYKHNKGLHLFISEENLTKHFNKIEEQLNEPKSLLDFHNLLRDAIIPIEERHLSIRGFHKKSTIAKRLKSKDSTAIKILPLYLKFYNDSTAYAIRNAHRDSSIMLPSKVTAINGSHIKTIHDSIAKHIVQDNGVTTWRTWQISSNFPLLYYTHIDTTETFIIDWLRNGNTHTTTLTGVSKKTYADSINKQTKAILNVEKMKPTLRYEFYDSLKTGYLKIGTFKHTKLKKDGEKIKYKPLVKSFFNQVETDSIQHIIIDLRNNTGGRVDLVEYLFSYLQPNKKKEVFYTKLSNRDFWFGETLKEKTTDKQRQPNFNGQVYVMTNGGSYSASVIFTVLAKQMLDATIVGQTAGGRPTGTTAGSFKIVRLKHSDILVRIPQSIFTYQKGITIQPDIEIHPIVNDYFSYDNDKVLQELLELIKP